MYNPPTPRDLTHRVDQLPDPSDTDTDSDDTSLVSVPLQDLIVLLEYATHNSDFDLNEPTAPITQSVDTLITAVTNRQDRLKFSFGKRFM